MTVSEDLDRMKKCSGCLRLRPLEELLAFWPVDDPEMRDRRWVCRPRLGTPCFSYVVGPSSRHRIALPVIEEAA
jgi:hypothetical protein